MVAAIRRAMMTHRKFSVVALLLTARQGEGLVEGKGFPGDWGSEGSQMAKCWPDDFTESNPLHVCTVREQNAGRRARWLTVAIKQIDFCKPASLYELKNNGSCIGTNKLWYCQLVCRRAAEHAILMDS